ncbi:MAG: MFS transporter [Actinobacteria bacterium]|nr:MFS transporter [Actinomycetota bacterium]
MQVQNMIQATRARWSLALLFLVMGVSSMAWVPRIPEIKSDLGLNDAQFGLMLAASSVGAVLGAQYSGRLVHRLGSKNTLRISQFVMPLGVITMGLTMTVPGIMAGLFVMGLGYSAMDIAANSQAVIVEKLTKRRFLASLHGAWSIGTFFTAIFGGAVVGLLTPGQNLLVLGIAAVFIFIPLTEQMLASDLDDHKGAEGTSSKMPWFGGKYILLWAFAVGSLGSFVAEGASMDWGGILLAEHMGVAPGFTASVFATFSLAMIVSRFTSDKIMEIHGSHKTVLYAGIVGGGFWAISILTAVPLSATNPIAAMILINAGFFAAGLGIGPIFPAYILASAEIPGVPPSLGIARIGVISIAGYFIGPTITGFISELTTLPIALMYPAGALILSGYLARYLKQVK